MKNLLFGLLMVWFLLLLNPAFINANPFASRLQQVVPVVNLNKERAPAIKYLGYLQISGKYHGVVQFNNKQVIVSESDILGKMIIIKISLTYLKYRFKSKEYLVKVAQNLD